MYDEILFILLNHHILWYLGTKWKSGFHISHPHLLGVVISGSRHFWVWKIYRCFQPRFCVIPVIKFHSIWFFRNHVKVTLQFPFLTICNGCSINRRLRVQNITQNNIVEQRASVTHVTAKVRPSYRPQRSCGQGNIFTPVCHSVHRGRENPPSPGGRTPLAGRPPLAGRTPPRKETPSPRHTVNERPVRILLECILV